VANACGLHGFFHFTMVVEQQTDFLVVVRTDQMEIERLHRTPGFATNSGSFFTTVHRSQKTVLRTYTFFLAGKVTQKM
jgi:hypothetical protein